MKEDDGYYSWDHWLEGSWVLGWGSEEWKLQTANHRVRDGGPGGSPGGIAGADGGQGPWTGQGTTRQCSPGQGSASSSLREV